MYTYYTFFVAIFRRQNNLTTIFISSLSKLALCPRICSIRGFALQNMIIEMTTNISNNPIFKVPAAISNGDKSSFFQKAINTVAFPKELLEWIMANQISSFEKMQRKSMRQPIYSEGDAMQYWLTRATTDDTHGTCK